MGLDEFEEGLLFHSGGVELIQVLMDHQEGLHLSEWSPLVQRIIGISRDGVILHGDELVIT